MGVTCGALLIAFQRARSDSVSFWNPRNWAPEGSALDDLIEGGMDMAGDMAAETAGAIIGAPFGPGGAATGAAVASAAEDIFLEDGNILDVAFDVLGGGSSASAQTSFDVGDGSVTTRAELRQQSEPMSTMQDAVMVTRNTFGAVIDACAKYHGTSASDMKLGAARFKDLFREEVAINWNDAPAEGVRSMFATGQDVTYESVEGDTLEFLRGLFAQIEESELPVVLAALYHAWTPASRSASSSKRKTTRRRRK